MRGKALTKLCLMILVFFPASCYPGWIEESKAQSLKWALPLSGLSGSSPAVGADGTIYIGSGSPANQLLAINPDRTEKWAFAAGASLVTSPALGSDGTIYFGSYSSPVSGKLFAINPDGTQKWASANIGGVTSSSPAIGADGTIYIGSWDGNLYALDPDGVLKWTFKAGDSVISSPAVASDGTIYLGSYSPDNRLDNYLYAINPDGSQKWAYFIGLSVYSPAVGEDGAIYTGSWDGNLYAINPDGALKWSFTAGAAVTLSPVIDSDGIIYAVSNDGTLYAVNSDGSKKWDFSIGDEAKGSPAIGADGTIFVSGSSNNGSGSRTGQLYAINSDGTEKWSYTYADCCPVSSLTLDAGGTIYSALQSVLYAVSTGCGGLADAPWPMFHRDVNHTGRAPNRTPPAIIATSPANNETSVAVDAAVTVTFSEVMASASITTTTFILNDGAINVQGTVTSDGSTATFTPLSDLAYDKTYVASITTGVTDTDGKALETDYTWQFTTRSAADEDDRQDNGIAVSGGCFISIIVDR